MHYSPIRALKRALIVLNRVALTLENKIRLMRMLSCLLFIPFVYAVTATSEKNGIVTAVKWASQVPAAELNAWPFGHQYTTGGGNPYFNSDYKYANVKLTRGRFFSNVKTKIDLAMHETYFISVNGVEIYMEAGLVKEVSFLDTTAEGIQYYKFQTGFPAIEKQTPNNFYMVLAEGACNFLKCITKKVTERRDVVTGVVFKDYETNEEYFLFLKGEMKKLKRDKEFILLELADKKPEVNLFIESNKLNMRNPAHITRLIKHYNTL